MAKRQKTKAFSIQGFDIQHYKTTDAYTRAVGNLFDRAMNDIVAGVAKLNVAPDKPFQFSDYPSAQATIKRVANKLAKGITAVVADGSRKQWLFACQKNDEFVASIMDTSKLTKARLNKMQDRNLDSLQTFQQRKVDGMNLSQRVWKYTEQFKEQIECGLDVGLGEGRSAQELSRDLRQNLKDPNRLFRRVRDKRGNLQLSKNAQAFHPGRGVYRSSYKNTMRLTRSEINMAYREADWLRWQQLDFVIGFEVHRTNHEPQCKCSLCERLKGRYPKTFKFRGWHPQCMCYVTPILISDEDFDAQELSDLKSALRGTEYKKLAVKEPEYNGMKELEQWAKDNQDAQGAWSSTPYFIKDNFIDGTLAKGIKEIALQTTNQTPTIKVDPIQEQLDQLQSSITAIKQMASEWGLNTFIIDDAFAKRNPQGVVNAITEMRHRVNAAMNELKVFVNDVAETIKQAKNANVDAIDMAKALSEINSDRRNWIMSKAAFKNLLADFKQKIAQAKSNIDIELLTLSNDTDIQINTTIKDLTKKMLDTEKQRKGEPKIVLSRSENGFFMQGTRQRDVDVYLTRSGVEVVIPKGESVKQVQDFTPERIENALEQLPIELRSSLKAVYLCDFFNPDDAYWSKRYKMKNFYSFATGGNGIVRFYTNKGKAKKSQGTITDDKTLIGTLSHECGHNTDRALMVANKWLSECDLWQRAIQYDLKKSGKGSVTWYGSKSVHEDYAESCMLYTQDPAKFRKEFPARYTILSRIITSKV